MKENIAFLQYEAYRLRHWSILLPATAGSGHTTTCLSAADIVSVLFFHVMQFDPDNFENPNNDRFILSKGHASPLLYAVWHELGKISEQELLTYRQIDSVLEGHPTLRFAYTEAATGSLGIGLSVGVGQALHAKRTKKDFTTYVLMGDGEILEGSVWEAVQLAVHYNCNNLVAIVDCNRLGQSDEVIFDHDIQKYQHIFESFGWNTLAVDGHNISALLDIFTQIKKNNSNKPTVIIARTIKGYGIDFAADKNGFHGKAFIGGDTRIALDELHQNFKADTTKPNYNWHAKKPIDEQTITQPKQIIIPPCTYKKGEMIATRKAYGQSLAQIGSVSEHIVALDAEVKNSTYSYLFEEKFPERFYQCYIAEQNMVGMGIGMHRRGDIPFISTFASFFSRAYDQIRMSAIGSSALRLIGSHCGVSIGQDGPSQMGLEDIALMRCIPDSIVLYPSDAVSTHALIEIMANYHTGNSYLRTTRMETEIIYDNIASFNIGGCNILKQSSTDVACVIGAGVTLHEALKAYTMLQKQNISISVIDLYSIKPLDAETILKTARQSKNNIIVVEDHYAQGGIGEAVIHALQNQGIHIAHLAVTQMPRSGKPEELLAMMRIDANAIVKKVTEVL